jgi:succinyl-CoA synthetase beta subunit
VTRLLEHHAKELLDRAGVSTPPREVARTRDEVFSAAARLGGSVVVKAHVSANRRAKAGGVRFADDPERAAQAAEEIFGRLFDGRPAESMLVEERVAFERELDRWRPPTELELEALDVASSEAHRGTARFIQLEGDIGLLCGGGGGSQVLFESVLRAGGRPACFTEIGGNPSAEKVRRLTGIVLRCPGVRGLLVGHNLTSNTQVDLVATGVVAALAEGGFKPLEFPVVAREVGTHDERGRAIFEEAGIEYLGEDCTLESAARRIVQRVRERTAAER